MKNILLVILFLSSFEISRGQINKDSLLVHLDKFLLLNGQIKKKDIDNTKFDEKYYIEDLLSRNMQLPKGDTLSIYKFYTKRFEDSEWNIIIFYNDSINIFNLTGINFIIQHLIRLKENNIKILDDKKFITYIVALSNLYKEVNQMRNKDIVLLYDYGSYKFWINTNNSE